MERTAYEQDIIKKDKERLMMRKKIKEARARKVFILKCMILSVILVAFTSIYGILIVNAADTDVSGTEPVKYYTSITIESGDTLWEIADEYRPSGCSTVSYVNEIKQLNHMGTDTLYAGQNLIVYYMSE